MKHHQIRPALRCCALVLPLLCAQNVLAKAQTVQVSATQEARKVVADFPPEAVMERFEVKDSQGKVWHYLALTEGEPGALIFEDGKLSAKLSRRDAAAFYSCRGYATATRRHWGDDADAWMKSLATRTEAVTELSITLPEKPTWRSIVEVARDPSLSDLESLVSVGTNPLNIIRKLSSARDNMAEREAYKKNSQRLKAVVTGATEIQLAAIIRPEDVSFVPGGLVMAYPKYTVEFFVSAGQVKVIQQPSFNFLSKNRAALFYAAGMNWDRCTPQQWMQAPAE